MRRKLRTDLTKFLIKVPVSSRLDSFAQRKNTDQKEYRLVQQETMELTALFHKQRIHNGGAAILLALYAPLGLVIFILRIFIGFHVLFISSLLPKFSLVRRVILRVMCSILGVIVTSENVDTNIAGTNVTDTNVTDTNVTDTNITDTNVTDTNITDTNVTDTNVRTDAHILVSNHISVLDHLAINLIQPCTVPNVWNLPSFLCWALGYQDMEASKGRQALVNNVKQYCSEEKQPVLAFPEGSITNGAVGLLKFSSWPFSIEQSVQPLIISATRPLLSVSLSHLSSSLWMDILWFLFVPCTIFHVKIIPVIKRQESQSFEEFAEYVQQIMAADLKLEATKFSSQDKAEYLKRIATDFSQAQSQSSEITSEPASITPPTTPPTPPPSPTQKEPPKFDFRKSWSEKSLSAELQIMVNQVKDVLLDLDEEVIRKDLQMTNSVDATITNIVEGRICQTTSEEKPTQKTTNEATTTTGSTADVKIPPSAIQFADTQFGKTSNDRQKSLAERKQALLASARKHFEENQAASD